MKYLSSLTINKEVFRINAELRSLGLKKIRPKDSINKPISFWIEKEPIIIDDKLEVLNSLVIIFGTRGCRWAWHGHGGGCIFCGYVFKNPRHGGDLLKQLDYVFNRTRADKNRIKLVKIFTSGSFLDEFEVPLDIRLKILENLTSFYSNLKAIQLETRPEHILGRENIENLKDFDLEIYFNVGLETVDDKILRLINKGFTFRVYEMAIKKAHENGFKMKTYLMMKQPFQTELDAMNDTLISGKKVIDMGTESLSINPMVIYSYTFVEKIWKLGLYRPPWLNTVIHVVKNLINYAKDKKSVVVCDPVAPGSPRGAHSCNKKCDKLLNKVLEKMVLSQSADIDIPECCEKEWKKFIEEEYAKQDLSYGNIFP